MPSIAPLATRPKQISLFNLELGDSIQEPRLPSLRLIAPLVTNASSCKLDIAKLPSLRYPEVPSVPARSSPQTDEFKYVGSELDLFAAVRNWKSYWSNKIRPFIHGDVLEVGAGIGSNTHFLDRSPHQRWVCLEPDENLIAQIRTNLQGNNSIEIKCGTLLSLASERFDTIIYIDVLEHIENDKAELQQASSTLRENGRIIVLSPAHQFLFTPFDAAIGHFRRYNTNSLGALSPAGLQLERIFYLDSAGMMLSLANRMLLKQSMPTNQQLSFWDRIPVSRALDPLLFGALGKSIIAVWKKPSQTVTRDKE